MCENLRVVRELWVAFPFLYSFLGFPNFSNECLMLNFYFIGLYKLRIVTLASYIHVILSNES